ncbi:major facilitator superfamily domain-containing protein [Zychaea mexicana]|uniref:major facilitator superfamily domain-containing protein n=1 Tax=Zychaea mexicana TaxID=64656 RepID=UPI0022FEE8B7|nr:major facilitator superfamily domain-containing protein [Zychaea mexicana]KAI9497524.1 major facilitator superfamily domain-containing protein [Zychaea mexicana]
MSSPETKEKVASYITHDYASSLESGKPVKFVYSPEERKLVRRINWTVMPLVCGILFVQFIDKSTLNYAAVMGIYEDTHITQDQFSWLGSIFYVGYLAFQIPNQYFLQRLPMSKYLGSILTVWGVCLACMALGKNFEQLAGLRFLLGFWEASTYPCIFLLISTLYRRQEQVVWFSTMFICNAAATSIGGLIGYGIRSMHGARGISAWQCCDNNSCEILMILNTNPLPFLTTVIIWGVVTFALGIAFFFFLADKPKSRWFRLTPEEELIVDDRLRDNTVVQNKDINMDHIFEAFKDPRFYCYLGISFLVNLQNGAVTIFSSQIISQMGFSDLDSILLNIPYGVAIGILLAFTTYASKRYDEIGYVAAVMGFITFLGALLLAVIPYGGAKLAGLYLSASSPIYVMLQTSISNNVTGYTKKIFYTGGNLVAYCIGNFVGPLMMVEHTAPRYIGGLSGYMAADILAIILFLYVRWSLNRENKRREKLRKEGQIPPPAANREELDLTDKQDMNFVYRP